MKNIVFVILIIFIKNAYSQSDLFKKISISGYGEVYYSYDFSNPSNHLKPDFLYNHKRHNELNLNLFYLKTNIIDSQYKVNFALMAGNYAQYNLSTEPTWAQFVYEANIGIKILKKKNVWLEAGIFPSHIGFESAVSADCWTLTRSILAENSPYYESGVKLSYTSKKEKIFISFMYLNGWQKISKEKNMQNPAFGTQFTFKPNSKLSFNYSNFLGSNKPDSLKSIRHFHNFYSIFEPNKKIGFITGFDIGFENLLNSKFREWYSPVMILKHHINKKITHALRAEYYYDKYGIIINTNTTNGFQTSGLSYNFDYNFSENIKLRLEGKTYLSKDKIFDNNKSHNNYSVTSNLSIKF